jgi:hypothetical protein
LLVGGFQVFGAAGNAGEREALAVLGADYRIVTQAGVVPHDRESEWTVRALA